MYPLWPVGTEEFPEGKKTATVIKKGSLYDNKRTYIVDTVIYSNLKNKRKKVIRFRHNLFWGAIGQPFVGYTLYIIVWFLALN